MNVVSTTHLLVIFIQQRGFSEKRTREGVATITHNTKENHTKQTILLSINKIIQILINKKLKKQATYCFFLYLCARILST